MSERRPARPTRRRIRIRRARVAGLLVAFAAIAAVLGSQLPASSSSSSPATSLPMTVPSRVAVHHGTHPALLGVAGGAIPHGVTVFDDAVPGVAHLDGRLLGALRRAASDAADDGVELYVDSGWRSPAYQEQLLREAVSKYGSEAEAARWVATPGTSAHVSGRAVDIGPPAAAAWLSEHGAAYALCQIYHNEAWHYELRPAAPDHGCPPMYADPTHDPRMRQ